MDLDLPPPRRFHLRDQVPVGIVTFGACDPDGEPEEPGRLHPGVGHVVSVTDVGDDDAVEVYLPLVEREEVGEDLAGVEPVGQPVDHRHAGVAREAHGELVIERPDHDPVDVAGEDPRHVLDRLAGADPDLAIGDEHRFPAQLRHRDLERQPGAEAGFVEDERQGLLGQLLVLSTRAEVGLELGRDREEPVDVGPGQIDKRQKVRIHASRPLGGGFRGRGLLTPAGGPESRPP